MIAGRNAAVSALLGVGLLGIGAPWIGSTAWAQQGEGFYAGAKAGVDFPAGDLDAGGGDATVTIDPGFAGALAGGYDFGAFRIEGELSYRTATVGDFSFTPDGDASQSSWTGMVNAYYDYDIGDVTLFAGAGLGVSHLTLDAGGRSASDTVLAWQGVAGAAYNLTPEIALTGEYHYVDSFRDPRFDLSGTPVDASGALAHSALFGVRYTFTPPAGAAAFVQARSYLVFFDFDSDTLTPDARSIVASAAADALGGGSPRLDVTGHTDRAGSDAYNQALSVRRANAVRDALIADGVPADIIVIRGAGESQLLVPTADDVREPQNRRVEIVIQ